MYAIRVNENTANQVQFRTPLVRSGSGLVGFFVGDISMLDIMAIPLSQGLFALVDKENYERLMQHNWFAQKSGNTYYAVRNLVTNGKKTRRLMHREILPVAKGVLTDHRNHCGLDNRESNLRSCSHAENGYGQLPQKTTKSKYKGVTSNRRKWKAQIVHNKKNIYLGTYEDEADAAKAYNAKASELFDEFARLNVI